jgi:hypothetical protein
VEDAPKEESSMSRIQRPVRSIAVAVAIAVVGLVAGDALAQAKASKKMEGCLVSIDIAGGKMVVRDRQSRKETEFRIKPGTVLDRTATAVKKEGRGAKLEDLETNRPVYVYYKPDPENDGGKFASRAESPNAIDEETGKPDVDLMEQFRCKIEP